MSEQEPATWYRTRSGFDIEEVKVSKQSAQCIWVGNEWNDKTNFNRRFIRSIWEDFWPTKQEAINFLIDRAKGKIRSAEQIIENAKEALTKLTQQQKEQNDQ